MDETGARPTAKPAQTPPEDPLLAPRLTDGQLALPHRYGEVRPTVARQEQFREGDRSYDFIVILSGAVTVLDHQAEAARELATGGLGEFVAELNLFTAERLSRYLIDCVVRHRGIEITRGAVRRLDGAVRLERVASAVGEGSIAIRFVSEHLGRRAGFAAAGALARQPPRRPKSTRGGSHEHT